MGNACEVCQTCQSPKGNHQIATTNTTQQRKMIDCEEKEYAYDDEAYIETDGRGMIMEEELFQIDEEEFAQGITHKSIGALTFYNSKMQVGVGSGILISKDLVLTAAHNIFNKSQNQQYTDLRFYPGAHGDTEEYLQVQSVRYSPQFQTDWPEQEIQFDYGLLRVKPNPKLLVDYATYMHLSPACEPCLKDEQPHLQICGYPIGIAQNYRPLSNSCKKRRLNQFGLARRDRIVSIDKFQMGYKINAISGQNGCPIITGGMIIGIHSRAGSQNEGYNIGRLIDADLIATLKKWGEQLGGNSFQINRDLCYHLRPLLSDKRIYNQRQVSILEYPSKFADLKKLDLRNKQLSNIDLTTCINLIELYLCDNHLTTIDLTNNIHLIKLRFNNNQIREIDLTKNTDLVYLSLHSNILEAIDLSNNIKLTQLYLWQNQLKSINLATNISLTRLQIQDNLLTQIDVHFNINLQLLNLWRNKLTIIDLQSNVNLREVCLNQNLLTQISLKFNINLTKLDLSSNQLTLIDLRSNLNLTDLRLSQNQLTNIDLRNNTQLIVLYLWGNQLKGIDLKNNIYLTELYLSQNQLYFIDLIKNAAITKLSLWGNHLDSIIFWYSPALSLEGGDQRTLNLSHQNSRICEITVLHSKSDSQTCLKFKRKLEDEYSGLRVWSGDNYREYVNCYNCKYWLSTKVL